ncbi:hypothetical protein IMG5_099650 [Ichthyophthirius multifiliis]|uniref:EF-hand domain-containing protein n=1 Tax=Ichthyophthirius multifiliis TaxID=5932 RepID=G0QS72_ICHMU|nr:hypothetical protein IMG5_099650 [Ichthyophthirius multifiliis]EGR31937.1 hypothetical protein IMG5_099650 [Ichthyophthirius multifiliis]|eukprot:XP_004035423.1 hypothetical protein IMG5_099650 [Ichthyophthirius multifiliis]
MQKHPNTNSLISKNRRDGIDHSLTSFKHLKDLAPYGIFGYGDLDKKDKEILKECLDVDKDGRITEKDFKEIIDYINKKKYL